MQCLLAIINYFILFFFSSRDSLQWVNLSHNEEDQWSKCTMELTINLQIYVYFAKFINLRLCYNKVNKNKLFCYSLDFIDLVVILINAYIRYSF